ncbi:alpha/beta hydrolase [Alteromonas sp. ASW11-130]|uniref:alpha/beta hydrolase n=1 Tax=Alteromonas sp. ASW11-130 TaxID=3015775 RepID=UPI002241B84A|nr:alpha/beta hydrolase [Alteromonas sp. ASW11-130]MCW8091048.1 lysophospholipase [Alteromonas sp. ASW11-130]
MRFITFLLSLGLLCLTIGCAIDVTPSAFIYQATQPLQLDTSSLQKAIQKDEAQASITTVQLTNSQDLQLVGVAVSYPNAQVNIVFFGGDGQTINKGSGIIHRFGQIPANILWVDYQGMGASGRADKLKVANLKSDALQVYDYAKEVFPTRLPTLVHGLSMGTLFATYIGAERDVDALVLDGALNDLPSVVTNMMPGWSRPFTSLDIHPDLANMSNVEAIKNYQGPVLFLVGEKDRVTPVEFVEQVYRAAPTANKTMYIIPEQTHYHALKQDATIQHYREFVETIK